NLCSALSVKDVSSLNKLSVCSLCAQSLGFGITSVLCRTNSLFMSKKLKIHFHHGTHTSLKIMSMYDSYSLLSSISSRPRIMESRRSEASCDGIWEKRKEILPLSSSDTQLDSSSVKCSIELTALMTSAETAAHTMSFPGSAYSACPDISNPVYSCLLVL